MAVNNNVRCARVGRKFLNEFGGGKKAIGYRVMAYRLVTENREQSWVAGFATQVRDHWNRPQGWIVLDSITGEVIFGAGISTRIGKGLGECLYLFARHLEGN